MCRAMVKLPFLPRTHPAVSVVRLTGVIASGGRFQSNLSDAGLAGLLERAFRRIKPDAVALAINSPGGSPVQSALIGKRIRRLAEETETKVFAFCEDVAASGGYWLAAAADEIYCDENSVVGSIGVISASFGFQDFIERQGVERRVHTAGESKSFLDPFRPEDPDDVARLRKIQDQMHGNFIAHIKDRRGARLKRDDIFTGEVWLGADAQEIGLVDGIGHLVPTMKRIYGDKTKFQVVQPRRSFYQRLGAPGASDLIDAVDDRLAWSRFRAQ